MAGTLALVSLVVTVSSGLYAGNKVAQREDLDTGKPAKLIILSVTTGVVAVVFWLWAVLNCALVHFDLGAVSFLLALGTSLYGGGALDKLAPLNSEVYRVSAICGYGGVSANYLLGLLLDTHLGLRVYYALGMLVWFAFLVAAVLIVRRSVPQVSQATPVPLQAREGGAVAFYHVVFITLRVSQASRRTTRFNTAAFDGPRAR